MPVAPLSPVNGSQPASNPLYASHYLYPLNCTLAASRAIWYGASVKEETDVAWIG